MLSPLFRGLYFPEEQMVAAIAVVALTLLAWGLRLARGDRQWVRHPLDWAFLALLGSYFLSTFFAANPADAVQSDILNGTAFLVYWIVGEWAQEAWSQRAVIGGLVIGALVAAFIGVGTGTGLLQYAGAFVAGRVYTTFQYPDAAAAYLAAAFIGAMHLADTEQPAWLRSVLVALAAFCAGVFILCLSRGAELVLPLALAIYILFQPVGRRVRTLLRVITAFVPAAAGATLALRDMGHSNVHVWFWLAAGMAIAALLTAGIERVRSRDQAGILGIGAIVVALAGAFVLRHRLGSLARLGRLSLSSYNAWSRIRWTEDALRVFLAHPIIGLGGGGWAAAYQRYQSYGYFTTQVHDFFAQTLVESGIVGGLCLVAAGVILIIAFFRTWRSAKPEKQALLAGVGGAAAMLVMHGAIDFTLSLGAALLSAAALIGLLRGSLDVWPQPAPAPQKGTAGRRLQPKRRVGRRPAPLGTATATFVGGVVVIVFVAVLLDGYYVGVRAVNVANAHQVAAAIPLYQEAISLNPLVASYRGDLAQLQVAGPTQPTTQQVTKATTLFQQALALDRYNPQLHQIYGEFLANFGQPAAGLAQLHQALVDSPFNSALYGTVAQADVTVAESDIGAKNVAGAKALLPDVNLLAQQLKHYSSVVPAVARKVYPTPSTTSTLQYAQGQADAMLGQWQPAIALLTPFTKNSNKSLAGTAAAWLVDIYRATKQIGPAAKATGLAQSLLGKSATQEITSVGQWVGAAG